MSAQLTPLQKVTIVGNAVFLWVKVAHWMWVAGLVSILGAGFVARLTVVSVTAIGLSLIAGCFLTLAVIMLAGQWLGRRVKGLDIAYDSEQHETQGRRGRRYLVKVVNQSGVPVTGVRVKVSSITPDTGESFDKRRKANRVIGRCLTTRDGEPENPQDGSKAEESLDLPVGQDAYFLAVSIYDNGDLYVLHSEGHWPKGWQRREAQLDPGFYRVVFRAESDQNVWGQQAFRFGATSGEIQNVPIFQAIAG